MTEANAATEITEANKGLLRFIEESPSVFHAVQALRTRLEAAGFAYLPEGDAWAARRGGAYYTVRNNSSIVAFRIGENVPELTPAAAIDRSAYHFQIAASHSDSPTFKVKAVPELEGPGEYVRLNVEAYGGTIDNTWFDRPLSLAGRVFVETDGGVESRLLSIDRDLLLIPHVAIHMNRAVNEGVALNRQVDLCPLFSAGSLKKGDFVRMLAEELSKQKAEENGTPTCFADESQDENDRENERFAAHAAPGETRAVSAGGIQGEPAAARPILPEHILGYDLFLVNRQNPTVWGWDDEFVSAPKLDDLQCAFASLQGFLIANNPNVVSVYACFDNEEVGSNTKQGAMSTFLADTLARVNAALGGTEEDCRRALARSFMVSCDNAHALHPSHPELADASNAPRLNGGIVIKEAANQKYTTDAASRAVFSALCRRANVPVQTFANRSDMAGGSTLGNLSNIQASMHAVDVGLPQLAMHSSFETTGAHDTELGIAALAAFYRATLRIEGADRIGIE